MNADSSTKIEKGMMIQINSSSESKGGKTSHGDKSDKLPDIINKPHEDHSPKILKMPEAKRQIARHRSKHNISISISPHHVIRSFA